MRILLAATLAAMVAMVGQAQVDGGGDIRVREEAFDDIPINTLPPAPGVTRGGENDYFRFRTRLWGSATDGDFKIFGRVANEWRKYSDNPGNDNLWDFEDELVVDQLYLEGSKLLGGKADFRVGRQDLIYGRGRVILEGTPKDGSRTIYFDAAKLVVRVGEKSTIDLLGIYNEAENDLAISSEERDVTGFTKGFNDMTESGGGVYAQFRDMAELPVDLYYLVKDESDWDIASKNDDGSDVKDADGNVVMDEKSGRLTHTVGARLMPKVGQVNFEFEGAYQTGEFNDDTQDVSGYMGFGGATWNLPMTIGKAKPYVGAACYYLSGDDPDTEDEDEGWNPLWARYPQLSELYVYAFDAEKAGYWSNVLIPHVEAGLRIAPNHKLCLLAGWMTAPEKNGPGTGDERGMLYTARYDFPLLTGVFGEKDQLYGHLLAEVLDPGDYYNVDDTSYFLRWELVYSF